MHRSCLNPTCSSGLDRGQRGSLVHRDETHAASASASVSAAAPGSDWSHSLSTPPPPRMAPINTSMTHSLGRLSVGLIKQHHAQAKQPRLNERWENTSVLIFDGGVWFLSSCVLKMDILTYSRWHISWFYDEIILKNHIPLVSRCAFNLNQHKDISL